jgi:pyruvate/2-oxoglutarate dehydrogenase complex dihydrolipoamide acyltransferase (E2) component
VHSILVPEGRNVPVGTPIAILADSQESLEQLGSYKPQVRNVYEEDGQMRTLIWQSYLKSDKGDSGGCS